MKRRFKFDDYEVNIIIKALIELRNQLIAEGRYTDAVDDLLIKLCDQLPPGQILLLVLN